MSGTSEPQGLTGEPNDSREPGIIPYSGASQAELGAIMSDPEFPPAILAEFDVSLLAGGSVVDVVFQDSRSNGFSLTNLRLAPNYILPAHTHNVDCLYYVVSGWIMLGRRRIDPGGGFLVMANRPYGYRAGSAGATVLEFRQSTGFNLVVTETSTAKWREIFDVVAENKGWPGFVESVALAKE